MTLKKSYSVAPCCLAQSLSGNRKWGQGDGSMAKGLAMQAKGQEFGSLALTGKAKCVMV